MNPIFTEYYSHEGCVCYKIKLPYTKYASHTVVLGKVTDGFEQAKEKALLVLQTNIKEALNEPVTVSL